MTDQPNVPESPITPVSPVSRYQHYYDYLASNVIDEFYNVRFKKLKSLKLNKVLRRKNPYLYKAKNIEIVSDLVQSTVDAFLSSQEETLFGGLLEKFAIFVSNELHGGFKSELPSVDLEFERDNKYYIVGIKSGTNWGNSDQIARMRENFKSNKETLKAKGIDKEIIAVNGCIYGKDSVPLKIDADDKELNYYKYAGQDFWLFITGDDDFYKEIIKPIDQEARKKDEQFKKEYAAKVNEMTLDFTKDFVTKNQIDWEKLLDFTSKRREVKAKSAKQPTKKKQPKT
jgi:site-specific DNA-methyltransferase (cytosine-N4-specific)